MQAFASIVIQRGTGRTNLSYPTAKRLNSQSAPAGMGRGLQRPGVSAPGSTGRFTVILHEQTATSDWLLDWPIKFFPLSLKHVSGIERVLRVGMGRGIATIRVQVHVGGFNLWKEPTTGGRMRLSRSLGREVFRSRQGSIIGIR